MGGPQAPRGVGRAGRGGGLGAACRKRRTHLAPPPAPLRLLRPPCGVRCSPWPPSRLPSVWAWGRRGPRRRSWRGPRPPERRARLRPRVAALHCSPRRRTVSSAAPPAQHTDSQTHRLGHTHTRTNTHTHKRIGCAIVADTAAPVPGWTQSAVCGQAPVGCGLLSPKPSLLTDEETEARACSRRESGTKTPRGRGAERACVETFRGRAGEREQKGGRGSAEDANRRSMVSRAGRLAI